MPIGLGNCDGRSDESGFTLVELVIIIVTLGILAAVAIPRFSGIAENSKVTATREELHRLKLAVVGNPAAISAGVYTDRGFEGDVGFAPQRLEDLVVKPDTVVSYNKFTRLGWNGPYVDSSGGDYLTDAWGVGYLYDPAQRRIASVGGGDTIAVSF
jgi:Tfp pilus assembly major pilin PilA